MKLDIPKHLEVDEMRKTINEAKKGSGLKAIDVRREYTHTLTHVKMYIVIIMCSRVVLASEYHDNCELTCSSHTFYTVCIP